MTIIRGSRSLKPYIVQITEPLHSKNHEAKDTFTTKPKRNSASYLWSSTLNLVYHWLFSWYCSRRKHHTPFTVLYLLKSSQLFHAMFSSSGWRAFLAAVSSRWKSLLRKYSDISRHLPATNKELQLKKFCIFMHALKTHALVSVSALIRTWQPTHFSAHNSLIDAFARLSLPNRTLHQGISS